MSRLVETLKRSKPPSSKVISENWPNVALRKEANNRTQTLKKHNTVEARVYLTRTMSHLCMVPLAWQKLPLGKLSNQTLMLTGLVTDEYRRLTKGQLEPTRPNNQDAYNTRYPGCTCPRSTKSTTNTLTHRITECSKYRKLREETFGKDDQVKKVSE